MSDNPRPFTGTYRPTALIRGNINDTQEQINKQMVTFHKKHFNPYRKQLFTSIYSIFHFTRYKSHPNGFPKYQFVVA